MRFKNILTERETKMGGRGSSALRNSAGTLTTQSEIEDMIMGLSDDDFRKQTRVRGARYFGQDFGRELNAFLASGDMEYLYERPDFKGVIERLDNAMVEIPKPITAERYVSEHTFPGFDVKHPEQMVGRTINTPGYLSTTIDAENSKFEFSNYPAKVVITAPKGSKAILGANDKEAEVLFHRNSSYRITGYKMSKNSVGGPQVVYYATLNKGRGH